MSLNNSVEAELAAKPAVAHTLTKAMTLPEKIVAARRLAALTQEELALRAQVTVRTIQRIENGQSVPRMHTMRAIANALNLPYDEIGSPKPDNITGAAGQSDTTHFLRILCLSCFGFLVVPYVHFLIPRHVLRKERGLSEPALAFARGVVRGQIWWVVVFHTVLLVTVALNFFLISNSNGTVIIHYLWVVFAAYTVNFIIVTGHFFRINAIAGLKTVN